MEPDQPDAAEQQKNSVIGRPFPKGKSGNPTGRPKGRVSILTHVERLLREGKEVQAKELAQALIDQFKRGNGSAIKEIMARIDGPLPEKQEHGGNITIRVEYEEGNAAPPAPGATEDRP